MTELAVTQNQTSHMCRQSGWFVAHTEKNWRLNSLHNLWPTILIIHIIFYVLWTMPLFTSCSNDLVTTVVGKYTNTSWVAVSALASEIIQQQTRQIRICLEVKLQSNDGECFTDVCLGIPPGTLDMNSSFQRANRSSYMWKQVILCQKCLVTDSTAYPLGWISIWN